MDFSDERWTQVIKTCRSKRRDFDCSLFTFSTWPFDHLIIRQLLADQCFYDSLKSEVLQLPFFEKHCDLYKLQQTKDLNSLPDGDKSEPVSKFLNLLRNDVRRWIEKSFDVQLSPQVDVSGSIYNQTDYLLCHDDKLEGRKIAFVFYLVDSDWDSPRSGGSLNLFASDEHFRPKQTPCKVISPTANTLVVFEVAPGSYHEVAEVIDNCKPRVALSGWFHSSNSTLTTKEHEMKQCVDEDTINLFAYNVNPVYVDQRDPQKVARIRNAFEEDSIIELADFFQWGFIQQITSHTENFKCQNTPINASYKVLLEDCDLYQTVESLICHEMMFALLSQLTGAELHPQAKSLLSLEQEEADDDDVMPEMPSEMEGNSRDDQMYLCTFELRLVEHGSFSVLSDSSKKKDESSNDVTINGDIEDQFRLEMHAFFLPKLKDWDEEWGGYLVYVDEEGEEIQRVSPSDNRVTLVYTDSQTKMFLKYVNCHAQNNTFFHLFCQYYVKKSKKEQTSN